MCGRFLKINNKPLIEILNDAFDDMVQFFILITSDILETEMREKTNWKQRILCFGDKDSKKDEEKENSKTDEEKKDLKKDEENKESKKEALPLEVNMFESDSEFTKTMPKTINGFSETSIVHADNSVDSQKEIEMPLNFDIQLP